MSRSIARPAKSTGDAPPLLFEWRRERGVKRRLAMWLLVVAAGHVALFYLFRVAPPLASRKPPPQHALLYLPPADSRVRSLLGALDDRFPGAVRRSEDHNLTAEFAALADAVPDSEPSWSTHRPALRPFPQPLVPVELPPVVQPGDPVLPEPLPAALIPPDAGDAPPVPVPVLVVDEGPDRPARAVIEPPPWPAHMIEETWPRAGSVPFMVGVRRSGEPAFCLPLSPATDLDLEALRTGIMRMRFAPVLTGGIQWINVLVRW